MELQLKQDKLQEVKEGIKIGDLFFDKRGEEIIRIQEIKEKQDQEDAFYLMLVGRCQKEGLKPKEGLSYEKIIGELIDWWKYKNKWKRPISKNDELAMKMIEKRLFAKTNRSRWFKN